MVKPDANQYDWLQQDALAVAPLLIGCELISHTGDQTTSGMVVEVEAYLGARDPASHSYRGITTRTSPMFQAGGAVYVYKSYGVHACLNIVTGTKGEGQAVLLRALEPLKGKETMTGRRHVTDIHKLCSGPGKLTSALGIGLELSGSRLGGTLSLIPPKDPIAPERIHSGPRIGISKAIDFPLRFYLSDNSFVSHRRRES